LNMHIYAARMDAFILTGNTLRMILEQAKTPIEWLAKELNSPVTVLADLLDLKDAPLSKIFRISILEVLKNRLDARGNLQKIDPLDVVARSATA
jgi:hypothetical protein